MNAEQSKCINIMRRLEKTRVNMSGMTSLAGYLMLIYGVSEIHIFLLFQMRLTTTLTPFARI
jgi:hypothetical protein